MVEEFQKLLELQADSIADIPLEVPFDINDTSMLDKDFPMTMENGKASTKIVIEPQKVGTVQRLTPLIMRIDKEDLEKVTVNTERDFDESAPELFAKYADVIIEIICVGLHNRKGPYPKYMPEFLKENCTWRDLHFFLNAILFRMGTLAFIDSTTMLTKVGPGAAEIIALQNNLESWRKN